MPDQDPAAANPTAEDYAGRKDLDDLRQAYRSSGTEAVRQKQRADLFEQEVSRLQSAANPRPDQRPRYEESLETLGLPLGDLDAFVSSRVERAVQGALQPIVQQLEGTGRARQHMLTNYGPDFVKFEQDLAQYLQSDPQVQNTYTSLFKADPAGAVEWGFLRLADARRRAHPQGEPGNGPEPDPTQQHARVPSAGGGGPTRPRTEPQWDAAREAWEAFQKEPSRQNAERYACIRLGMVYSEDFLAGRKPR